MGGGLRLIPERGAEAGCKWPPCWCHGLPSLAVSCHLCRLGREASAPARSTHSGGASPAALTPAAVCWAAAGSPCRGRSICATASFTSFTSQAECERIIAVGGKHGFERSMAGDGVQSVRTSSSSLLTMDGSTHYGSTYYSHTNHSGAHLVDLLVLARRMSERPNHAADSRADRKPDHGSRGTWKASALLAAPRLGTPSCFSWG